MKIFRAFEGPYKWELPDPDNTHRIHQGKDLKELVQNIVRYRSQNRLPEIDSLDIVISTYLCGLPENCGKCEEIALKRGFLQYLKGGIALVRSVVFEEYVTQEVADARAAMCKDCSANVFYDKGAFIKWSDDIAEASVGDRKCASHNEIGNCVGCSCCLRAKVWYGGKIDLTTTEATIMKNFNRNCWQLKEM